jgi:iron(II)-dependent oxidoreductase
MRPVDPSHPVSHVSCFEAEGYARFRGLRLPRESEWEAIASLSSSGGGKKRWPGGAHPCPEANLNLCLGDTAPAAPGVFEGNVWEWTASPFLPYPGFRTDPYKGYSLPWFGSEHRVLRGGCHLSHPMMARSTFRNWFIPGMRAFPSGLRLAVDQK